VPFWQAFLVAAVLLHSVNAKNIFYRSLEGFGPDAPGKQVAGLLGVCCDETFAMRFCDSMTNCSLD